MSSSFDALAPTYDQDFTHGVIARHLRARVHTRLYRRFRPGEQVLELGCGTGEDALVLAKSGIRVLATDSSAAMLQAARTKTADLPLVTVEQLDLNAPHDSIPLVDHAFSNFGALNCVVDRRALARWLAVHIQPGGMVGLGVMAPYCAWEIGWHILRADFRIAFRRIRGQAEFHLGDNIPLRVYYPTIKTLTAEFAPHFKRVRVEPLGLFLPPTALYPLIETRPRLLNQLTRLDESIKAPGLSMLADHYWVEFERVA